MTESRAFLWTLPLPEERGRGEERRGRNEEGYKTREERGKGEKE